MTRIAPTPFAAAVRLAREQSAKRVRTMRLNSPVRPIRNKRRVS